ncbi:MAG: sensor histidine kinase, partial [Alphaproteobacteria bacterium]
MTRRKFNLELKPAAPLEPVSPSPANEPLPELLGESHAQAAEGGDKARSVLLAHISHGFRTPLNAIIGFSEIMEREMFGKIGIPRYIEYVHDIRASAQHLLRLIEDVVDLSNARSGALGLDESEIEVAALVRSACLMQRDKAGQAGVQIMQEVPENFPRLLGDRRRVRQILQNLVSNAVRCTSRGGMVQV